MDSFDDFVDAEAPFNKRQRLDGPVQADISDAVTLVDEAYPDSVRVPQPHNLHTRRAHSPRLCPVSWGALG